MENGNFVKHDYSQEPEMTQCKTCGFEVLISETICPFCESIVDLQPIKI